MKTETALRVLSVLLFTAGFLMLPDLLHPVIAEPVVAKARGYDYFSPYAPPSECSGRQWVRHQSDADLPWHECVDLVLKIAAHRGL